MQYALDLMTACTFLLLYTLLQNGRHFTVLSYFAVNLALLPRS